jgi:hypothetical protein
MKGWPHELLGPRAFREVFYPSGGPGGYPSPTGTSARCEILGRRLEEGGRTVHHQYCGHLHYTLKE